MWRRYVNIPILMWRCYVNIPILPDLHVPANNKVLQWKSKVFVCLKAQNKQILFSIADSKDQRKADIPLKNRLTHAS